MRSQGILPKRKAKNTFLFNESNDIEMNDDSRSLTSSNRHTTLLYQRNGMKRERESEKKSFMVILCSPLMEKNIVAGLTFVQINAYLIVFRFQV